MSVPGNWKIEEILSLTYYKKVNLSLIYRAVESFSCLDELIKPQRKNDISDFFSKNELFEQDINPIEEAKKQIELCEKRNVDIVSFWDEKYPQLLSQIHLPPVILFVKGQLQNADSVSISMVGTRKCTTYGKLNAEEFASYFAQNGIIVTSGLAMGIDTISHLSAIETNGITYAVLGCGIDALSSSYQQKYADKIVESGGAIISEFKCGVTAKPGYFPQRNRIISGISKATLIVESDVQGGSMITAKFAFDQGRDVFAIPGHIKSEKSRGTNFLIKKNIASLATSPHDMMEDLGLSSMFETTQQKQIIIMDSVEKSIFDNLSHEPIHIDEIANKANLEITDTMVKLLNMEFNGIIKQLPGKYYIKAI
ncbi:MAG: DNA-processing protein DprA [bacterium]